MDPIPISSAKQEANRNNAEHSTGPRTEEGKARSAMNARTHGLCSDHLLIPGEDSDQLNQLRAQYLFQIEPSTPIERTVFLEIVGGAWKLQRIQRMEGEAYSEAQSENNSESLDALLEDDKLQKKLEILARHKARIERSFYRALKEMKAQQTNRGILQQAIHAPFTFPDQADAKHFAKRTHEKPQPAISDTCCQPLQPQPAPVDPGPQPVKASRDLAEPMTAEEQAKLEAIFTELDDLFLPPHFKEGPKAA